MFVDAMIQVYELCVLGFWMWFDPSFDSAFLELAMSSYGLK